MSSDTKPDQIQIIKWSEASEVETSSRKSNSEHNSKVSEASEQEVSSRSSDSYQRYLKNPSESKRDQHQKQDSKILRYTKTLIMELLIMKE